MGLRSAFFLLFYFCATATGYEIFILVQAHLSFALKVLVGIISVDTDANVSYGYQWLPKGTTAWRWISVRGGSRMGYYHFGQLFLIYGCGKVTFTIFDLKCSKKQKCQKTYFQKIYHLQ